MYRTYLLTARLTKKNVLLASLTYIPLVIFLYVAAVICDQGSTCNIREDEFPGMLIFIFSLFVLMLTFSLITYPLEQSVFEHWVKFAIWATPLLMFLTYLINGGGNNGFGVEGVIGGGFDIMLYMILYGLYSLISFVLIVRAYQKTKRG